MNKIQKIAIIPALGATMLVGGAIASYASLAAAQTADSTTTAASAAVTTGTAVSVTPAATTADPVEAAGVETHPQGHAPIGGDGNVTAISGTTITMQEESDEGGASYTIDASKATVTNNGAAAQLSDLKVGDKIFVQGAVSGTSVSATSISLGHGHGPMGR